MPSSQRVLQSSPIPANSNQLAEPPQALSVDSDVVVVLAALLCALICVVGLALVARCAWLRRAATASSSSPLSPPAKGLKKKAIRSLPKMIYSSSSAAAAAAAAVECPICLAEFCEGEEMRALPQCGHRFHVACIDTWLAAHSSCPSCRHVLLQQLVLPTGCCDTCGAPTAATSASAAQEEAAKSSGTASTFLP